MVDRQRTFELIPVSLVVSNGQKPPMTSKQAKKAHQLATRGPKISRAELRREAAKELARQKKEDERRTAAAKAEAAREKKATKEQAEREARKKMGVPEPSKFVRASQPTILKHVKYGRKRTREEEAVSEESDTSTVRDNANNGLNSEHRSKKVEAESESEDDYGGFPPSFSQLEIGAVLKTFDSSAISASKQDNVQTDRTFVAAPQSPRECFAPKKNSTDELPWDLLENPDDMAASRLLSEAADAAAKSLQDQSFKKIQTGRDSVLLRPITTLRQSPSVPRFSSPHIPPKQATTTRVALQDTSINMPPSLRPAQTKGKRAITFAPSPPKLRRLPRMPPQSITNAAIPSSLTQAFLDDHLDQFLPSPTREIRELLDDVDDLPTNTQIARELKPNISTTRLSRIDSFDDLICTQDLVLSSQDILEITTPYQPALKAMRSTLLPKSTPTSAMRELKQRFFEEKEEDLIHAAIQESRALALQQDQQKFVNKPFSGVQESEVATLKRDGRSQARGVRGISRKSFHRTVSNATDYGEDEFYGVEEELLALC